MTTTSKAHSAKTSDAINAVRELAAEVRTEDQRAALEHLIHLAQVTSDVRYRMGIAMGEELRRSGF